MPAAKSGRQVLPVKDEEYRVGDLVVSTMQPPLDEAFCTPSAGRPIDEYRQIPLP